MKRTQHALLVEDSADDAELMLAALAEHCDADKVVIAKDGEEALDYLYRRGGHAGRPFGNPVLILLDIKMPKMDGLEVLRVIKGDPALKAIPVVMLTSSREERDVTSSYRLGTNGYVVKPLLFGELHAVLQKTAAFWLTVNEPCPDAMD
jgi:CheY-like chemotaxis protein